MKFKKTLETLLIAGALIAGTNFKGLSQNPQNLHDSTKQNFVGSQIIQNEPPSKENYIQIEIDAIKKEYENSINNILKNSRENGFSSLKNNQEIESLWNTAGEQIWKRFSYKPQTWLIDGIETGFIDCDLSAYLAGDIMNHFDINSKIIYIPQHAILETELPGNENLYIETTNNNTIYKSKKEYQEEYPITCGEIDFKKVPNYLEHETNWMIFMKGGEYKNALKEADARISLNPGFFGYTDRAITNTFLEKYSDAMKDLNSAEQIDTESQAVHLLKAKTNCHFDYFEKAKENYSEFMEINKKTTETFEKEIEIANTDEKKSELYAAKSITNLSLANLIRITDSYYISSNNCNEVFSKVIYGQKRNQNPSPEKKFLGDAEKDFNKAINSNPKNPQLYLGRAMITFQLSDFGGTPDLEKVLEDLNKAASLADSFQLKNAWKYYLGKAKMHLNSGNSNEAIANLDLSISKLPAEEEEKSAGLYYQKALEESKVNRFEKALENYTKALETYETSLDNQYFSYWGLFNTLSISIPKKINKELCHCFPKFLIGDEWKILPDSLEIIEQKGKCNYALKNYEEAINDFNKVLPNKDNASEIYFLRSESQRYLGNYEGAISDLDAIINNYSDSYSKESYELYFRKGSLYEKLDDFDSAIDNYNKAIKEIISKEDIQGKPFLTQALHNRAFIKKRAGNKKGYEKDIKVLEKIWYKELPKKDKLYKMLF